MALQMGILVLALLGLSTALVCPDGGMCEDRNTCCKNTEGGYGCCPLPHAECCSDHLHCCYEGTLCDLVHEKCVNKTVSLPWMRRLPPKQALPVHKNVRSVTCPGGTSSCPDGYTCCLLTSGDYGCCPFPKATCCSDHVHCCPSDTVCDLDRGVCRDKARSSTPLSKKIPAVPNDVVCPDKAASCPDRTTCCQMTNGSYGCCPMPNAVCCSDHMHCCPEGTQCDLFHSTCVTTERDVAEDPAADAAAVTALEMAQERVGSVPCNDSVACADGNTCCKRADGEWACCPLSKAVCCEDHEHCCPHGTVCNLAASTCDDPAQRSIAATPWLHKGPPVVALLADDNNKCDPSKSCPRDATCCRTTSGRWACCPLTQAVCCDDHIHCCPHGTVCNLEAETCDEVSGLLPSRPWVEKVPALTSEVPNEKCDGQTMCPGGTTCCKRNSGDWACCPLPQAVCCDDHEHCCPKSFKCNVEKQTCDKPGGLSLPWLHKIPTLRINPVRAASSPARRSKNMCDSSTSCPRDTTCCFMDRTQKWGCCPLPNAICCSSGNHCCPAGHACEPHRSSCSRGSRVIPWFTKLAAVTEPGALSDVKCDDKSSCASGTTCCRLPTGEWGCCPLVKAVCCADHEHCCPQGYTCNMHTETCEKSDYDGLTHVIPQLRVERPEPAASEDEAARRVLCDGAGEFHCSEHDTCCKISASEWACCPSPKAVCCPDSKHCCPAGYTCDLKSGGCTVKNTQQQLTWDTFFGDRKKRDFLPHGL